MGDRKRARLLNFAAVAMLYRCVSFVQIVALFASQLIDNGFCFFSSLFALLFSFLRFSLHLSHGTPRLSLQHLCSVFAVMDEHPGDEGRALVARVLQLWGQPQVREQFTALLRVAVSREEAKVALRDLLTRELLRRLERQVGTNDATMRAALVASQLAGLAMTRFVIGIRPIATSSDAQLVEAIGPTIQRYLTGKIT